MERNDVLWRIALESAVPGRPLITATSVYLT